MSKSILISNLKNLLVTIINGVKLLEKPRINLYKNPGFNYDTLCKLIDKKKIGTITVSDLFTFLQSNSVNVSKSLIQLLITHFGMNKEGIHDTFLTYNEFKLLLYPKTFIGSKVEFKNNNENIDFDLQQVFSKLILNELKLLTAISFALDKFFDDDTFTVYDIIKLLNQSETNYIDENMIEKFCMNYNIELDLNEMKIILYYLKADSDRRISYNQLKSLFKLFVVSNDMIKFNKNSSSLSIDNLNQIKLNSKNSIDEYQKINLHEFLLSVMKYETILYNCRKQIFLNQEIIPIELFYIFDIEEQNMITKDNFKNTLYNEFNISPTNEEINIVYHQFSENEDYFEYDDFKKMLIPFDELDNGDKLIELNNEEISPESKELIVQIMKLTLTLEEKIEKLKMQYVNNKNFSPYEEFLILKGQGFPKARKIDKRMVYNFLVSGTQKNDNLTEFGISLIFSRFDYDRDLMISYEDFVKGISPINNYQI